MALYAWYFRWVKNVRRKKRNRKIVRLEVVSFFFFRSIRKKSKYHLNIKRVKAKIVEILLMLVWNCRLISSVNPFATSRNFPENNSKGKRFFWQIKFPASVVRVLPIAKGLKLSSCIHIYIIIYIIVRFDSCVNNWVPRYSSSHWHSRIAIL